MTKTISLTEYTDGTFVPKTFYIFIDKIDYIIEEDVGSTVVLSNEKLSVIEPANYILNKINSFGDFND
jgi:hypothetical protein